MEKSHVLRHSQLAHGIFVTLYMDFQCRFMLLLHGEINCWSVCFHFPSQYFYIRSVQHFCCFSVSHFSIFFRFLRWHILWNCWSFSLAWLSRILIRGTDIAIYKLRNINDTYLMINFCQTIWFLALVFYSLRCSLFSNVFIWLNWTAMLFCNLLNSHKMIWFPYWGNVIVSISFTVIYFWILSLFI